MKVHITLGLFFISLGLMAQPFNQEAPSQRGGKQLLGKINKEGLSEGDYGEWFLKNYNGYEPDRSIASQLEGPLSDYTITAFMGTWCGDSKREVPRMYKLLEMANFPMERLTMVAVNRDAKAYKQSPGGEHEGLNIHRVPTFIVYKDGKEVNRIVESPVNSLENDLLSIINDNYTSNYHGVTMVHQMMSDLGLDKFVKKRKKLTTKLRDTIPNWRELNTYSYTLFHHGKEAEAIEVARLNILLFPEESGTYVRLANELRQTNQLEEAKIAYAEALAIDPENKTAKSALEELNQ